MQGDERRNNASMHGWTVAGLALIALHGGLLWMSPAFEYGRPVLERPTGWMVALLMAAGLIYLAALVALLKPVKAPGARWWVWMIGAGLAMRLLMFPATPIMETDFYRYLWDGGLAAHGLNPYEHRPEQVIAGEAPALVLERAEAAGAVVERVNHPHLRTIYPAVAQGAFVLAHWAAPWRLEGLRAVWLLFDVATLILVLALLRRIALPAAFAVVYWWNPLLIKEIYNSAHMDVVILPFVAGALLLAVSHRPYWAAGALGLAAGVKLWPVLLLPVLLRQRMGQCSAMAGMSLLFAVVAGLSAAPFLMTGYDDSSGLRAYASGWQMNDSIFLVIHAAAGLASAEHAHLTARLIVAALLIGWVAWLCRVPADSGRALCERALWAVAALFLLSPTQFPWYWAWLAPLLAVRPSPGLLILTATLPLYYLRFPMRELGLAAWFDYGVVWIQFGPAFALLAWEAWRRTLRQRTGALEASPAGVPAGGTVR